jgi:hypothetical protein
LHQLQTPTAAYRNQQATAELPAFAVQVEVMGNGFACKQNM